ncbi:MAG TPA: sigma-70 family RNA polymerase sigma factor [Actinomycetota bacterium]|nr:sigma-70 family RNA polymerase sigma factor [Actinomycetota bacterium]
MAPPDAWGDPEPSDELLLQRAAGGDQPAFSALVKRHEDRVFAIAMRITGDRADALDATQDTFVSVFRQSGSFRAEAAFTTWLYRVAVNACRDLLRKRKRLPEPTEELPEQARPGIGTEDVVGLRLDLTRALAQLPEDYRDAVLMHDLGAIPYDEIAEITGVALGTVKSRISRGRRRLAELLEQPAPAPASKEQDG